MNYDSQSPGKLLKAVQVADRLNVSRAQAYRLMQEGDIPTVRIRGSIRVRPEDLDRYIQENLSGKKVAGWFTMTPDSLHLNNRIRKSQTAFPISKTKGA